MIFIYITLGISSLALISSWLLAFEAEAEMKRLYPDFKIPKKSLMEKISYIFRIILTCLVPVINVSILWSIIWDADKVKEKAIENLYFKYSKGVKNDL